MANQIKKKYIENDAIDGLKLLLQSDQTLRRLMGDGSTQDVIAYLEGLISSEEARALAAEGSLDTRITTLEGQVGEDLQAAISQLQSEIAQEASDRESADNTLQSNIDAEKARIDAILEASEADKDSFAEIVSLINSIDTENDQAFASYVLSNDAALAQEEVDRIAGDAALQSAIDAEESARQSADSALDARIVELENSSDVIEIDSLASAPTLGLQGKLYVAKDSNKLYRWATTSGGSLDFDLTVGSGEEYETLESAIAAASNGQNILVKAGTYLVSSTINVNKELKIVGEDADTVIFETAGETSDPVVMFNFSANNSAIAKMTVKHKKPNNTSVETAIVASGGGFPQTRVSNFIVEDCKIEYAEFGVVVRAEDWCVRDSQFTYATGSGSNSNRCVGIYGTKGNSYIKDNFLKNDVLNGTSFRPFYLTSTTGSNPNETVEGKLVIEGTTHVGALAQFFNQDNTQSAGAGTFELQIKDNVINETNLFAGVACYVENAGDLFSSITLSGNTLSNLHAADGGKGVYGVYGVAAFRSSPLVVHASNNTLGQEVFRTGWESVEGSLIGKETAVPAFSVSLDSVIPASGDAPSVSGGSTSEYVEVSEQADLTGIESDITSLDARLDALEGISFEKENFVISAQDVANGYIDLQNEVIAKSLRLHVGRLAGFEGEDYELSTVGGVTRITFINSFASSGTEPMAEGDKVKVAYHY